MVNNKESRKDRTSSYYLSDKMGTMFAAEEWLIKRSTI